MSVLQQEMGVTQAERIVIMYPERMVRYGLRRLFSELVPQADIRCVASLAALSTCAELTTVKLIVSGISDEQGSEAQGAEWLLWLQQIRAGQPLLVVSGQESPSVLVRLAQGSGVSLVSVQENQALLTALAVQALAGRAGMSEVILAQVRRAGSDAQSAAPLTLSEQRVFALLRQGYSVTKVAHQLCRSVKTVSTHKRQIMRKLGVTSEVALFAQKYERR